MVTGTYGLPGFQDSRIVSWETYSTCGNRVSEMVHYLKELWRGCCHVAPGKSLALTCGWLGSWPSSPEVLESGPTRPEFKPVRRAWKKWEEAKSSNMEMRPIP